MLPMTRVGSIWEAAEAPIAPISRRLGHATPSITLNVYGHLFKTDDRAAAIMEAALRGKNERSLFAADLGTAWSSHRLCVIDRYDVHPDEGAR
jgi:hypothetical protein